MTRPSKELTALSDPDNIKMEEVPQQDPQGLTVEDAYRHLAGMPPEPVIEPEP